MMVRRVRTTRGDFHRSCETISGEPPPQTTHFNNELIRNFDPSRDGKQLAIERGTASWDVVLHSWVHELSAAWGEGQIDWGTINELLERSTNKERKLLGGSSFVAVVKSADLWYRHDSPHFHWLNRSVFLSLRRYVDRTLSESQKILRWILPYPRSHYLCAAAEGFLLPSSMAIE